MHCREQKVPEMKERMIKGEAVLESFIQSLNKIHFIWLLNAMKVDEKWIKYLKFKISLMKYENCCRNFSESVFIFAKSDS